MRMHRSIHGLLLVGALVGQAHADFTRGDAQAMLNNYPPGNVIYDRSPRDGLDIRPFAVYGGNTYCEDDWHIFALTWDVWVFRPKDPFCFNCVSECADCVFQMSQGVSAVSSRDEAMTY